MSCTGTVHRVEAEAVVAAWVFSIGVDVSHRRYYDGGSRPKQAVPTFGCALQSLLFSFSVIRYFCEGGAPFV